MGVSSFPPPRVPRPPSKTGGATHKTGNTTHKTGGTNPEVATVPRSGFSWREIWNRREAEREVELMLAGREDEYQYQPMPEGWVPEWCRLYFNLRKDQP